MKKIILSLAFLLFVGFSFAQIRIIKPITSSATSGTSCCGFSSYNSEALSLDIQAGKNTVIYFDKEIFDDANAFEQSKYIAPSDGVYQFNVTIGLRIYKASTNATQLLCNISSNAAQSNATLFNLPANFDKKYIGNLSAIFKLKKGEEVVVNLFNMGNAEIYTDGNFSKFSGVKLY